MTEKNFSAGKYAALALYGIVLLSFFYTGYFRYHLRLPEGSDEFGYLNMAKAVANGRLFLEHCERPFDKGLLAHLQKLSFPVDSLHFICPHAYWLYKTFKVVNQYPPGTGIVLSVLPFKERSTAAPAIFALLLMLSLCFAFVMKSGGISFLQINIMAFVAFFAFVTGAFPLSFPNYNTVNSCAPSFGILIAAGYLLEKKPGVSIALLGTSVIFRIANVILFIPLLILYLWRGWKIADYFSWSTCSKALRATVFFLAGGAGFYLLYMWILLGNPFSQTYPDEYVKLGLVSLRNIISNISYFFDPGNRWFMFHLFILTMIVLLKIYHEIPTKWAVFSLAIIIYNYTFFIGHWFAAEYYPYASGMICAGILLNFSEKYAIKTSEFHRLISITGISIILSAIIFSIFNLPRTNASHVINKRIQSYRNCFSSYDVVWAETRSGTIEYATDKAGFRYQWGSSNAKKDVLLWLSSNGYKQAIWVDDLEKSYLDTVDVEKDLQNIRIGYTKKTCPDFGTIIELK